MDKKFKLKIKIKFGNLKLDYKNNFYLAGQERSFENQIKYVYVEDKDILDCTFVYYIDEDFIYNKMINLRHFEKYEILEVIVLTNER